MRDYGLRCLVSFVVFAAVMGLGLASAQAHQGFFTTYSHHVEPGELALMLLNDFTSPSKYKRDNEGQGEHLSHMLELKYHPTNRLALEFMWEGFEDVETGEGRYTGYRYEARWRLFEREVPLNPMVYAEYENLDLSTRYKMEVSGWIDPPYVEPAGEEPYKERILESRLVLSQDLGRWNLSFNWINESDLDTGNLGFGYTMGAMLKLHDEMAGEGGHHGHHEAGQEVDTAKRSSGLRPAALSFEFFGALGDKEEFGFDPPRQEHYFQPGITLHAGERTMISLGYAMGLTEASDDLFRFNFGWKF